VVAVEQFRCGVEPVGPYDCSGFFVDVDLAEVVALA